MPKCAFHPEVEATCDLCFPSCPLCEECRKKLEEIRGFDPTIPYSTK